MRLSFSHLALLLLSISAYADMKIDGVLDELEWGDAQSFSNFVITEPFTRAAPPLATQVKVLSTPAGLVLGFRAEQPEAERTRIRKARDSRPMSSDIVYAFIDFNGNGESAYEFTVNLAGTQRDGTVVDENKISPDWDGEWESAVHEDATGWSVEIRLPWSIAPMQKTAGEERTIGVNFGRYNWNKGQRYAFPAIGFDQPRFVSDFQKIKIRQYEKADLRIIPYIAAKQDFVNSKHEGNAGVDVFWKPNSQHQVALTLNPDFGQVESDELVVNFSAIETFYSDKRPFFTENQSVFDLRAPEESLLVNTRRIGATSDDGNSAISDIDVALKANGSFDDFSYGVFAARENDASRIGRDFWAARLRVPVQSASVGYLMTRVDHSFTSVNQPYTQSTVHTVDYNWKFDDAWIWDGQFSHSLNAVNPGLTTQDNALQDKSGNAIWTRLKNQVSPQFNYFVELTRFGQQYDINDFGYMQRSNLRQAYVDATWQPNDFDSNSSIQGIRWNYRLKLRDSDDGVDLPEHFLASREVRYNDTTIYYLEWWQQTAGRDDLLSEGNGVVNVHSRASIFFNYVGPQTTSFRWEASVWPHQEGVSGIATQWEFRPSYVINDHFSLGGELHYMLSNDWLIKNPDYSADTQNDEALLGRYRRKLGYLTVNFFWTPVQEHEFRVKFQWLGMTAEAIEGMQVDNAGNTQSSDKMLHSFSVNDLGLQARYRYAFGPSSDFYLVYSRGGDLFLEQENPRQPDVLFNKSFSLRDADQLLAKLRYRF